MGQGQSTTTLSESLSNIAAFWLISSVMSTMFLPPRMPWYWSTVVKPVFSRYFTQSSSLDRRVNMAYALSFLMSAH